MRNYLAFLLVLFVVRDVIGGSDQTLCNSLKETQRHQIIQINKNLAEIEALQRNIDKVKAIDSDSFWLVYISSSFEKNFNVLKEQLSNVKSVKKQNDDVIAQNEC
jgi:hypothetical protein